MFNMRDSSRMLLSKNCPELLNESDLRVFLLALDDFIVMNGLDEDDNMTTFGHEIQSIYDEIYMCNE